MQLFGQVIAVYQRDFMDVLNELTPMFFEKYAFHLKSFEYVSDVPSDCAASISAVNQEALDYRKGLVVYLVTVVKKRCSDVLWSDGRLSGILDLVRESWLTTKDKSILRSILGFTFSLAQSAGDLVNEILFTHRSQFTEIVFFSVETFAVISCQDAGDHVLLLEIAKYLDLMLSVFGESLARELSLRMTSNGYSEPLVVGYLDLILKHDLQNARAASKEIIRHRFLR
jgi:hypothetical protein